MKNYLFLTAVLLCASPVLAGDNEKSPAEAPPSTGKVNYYQVKTSTAPITVTPKRKLSKRSKKKLEIPNPEVKPGR